MKKLFSTRVRIVLVVAVLLAVVLTVISGLTGINIPAVAVQGVLTPIRAGISHLTDQAEQLYDYIFRYEDLLAENTLLREQIAQMEDDARHAEAVERENARLRDLLDLVAAHEDYKLVDGYIISWSSTEWSSTFTINRGSAAGIQPGMCVITANNEVVGLVSEVGVNYAVVKTVLDSSLEISATITPGGYNGMVQGGYSSGQDGYLRMDYLPSSAIIHINDQVVTTGSTVYPRNLILGHVIDAGFEDTGVAKFALLEPAVDILALEQVFVVTSYEVG